MSAEKRPVRMCDSCGGVDDHPRHVHGLGPGQVPTSSDVADKALANASDEDRKSILAQIMDQSTQVKHLDCCASDGCPDGTCNTIHRESPAKTDGKNPASDSDVLRGQKLVDYLTSGKVDHVGNDMNSQRTTEAQIDAEHAAATLYQDQEN